MKMQEAVEEATQSKLKAPSRTAVLQSTRHLETLRRLSCDLHSGESNVGGMDLFWRSGPALCSRSWGKGSEKLAGMKHFGSGDEDASLPIRRRNWIHSSKHGAPGLQGAQASSHAGRSLPPTESQCFFFGPRGEEAQRRLEEQFTLNHVCVRREVSWTLAYNMLC